MRTRLVSFVTVSVLALAACGGGGSGPQGEVADLFVEAAEEEGLELDRDCVEEATAKLSDADAEAIIEAGPEGDAEISDEGDAVGEQVFECIGLDSFVDTILAEFEGDEDVDVECLREALGSLQSPDEIETGVLDAMFSCADIGG